MIHWLHIDMYNPVSVSNIKEREKQPLENAVYFFYAGQASADVYEGSTGAPGFVARRLDNGIGTSVTQIWQYVYNSRNKIQKIVDPAGRISTFVYDTTDIDTAGIDLLNVYQEAPGGQSTDPFNQPSDQILAYGDYSMHRPGFMTDAAGQTTEYSYNAL